MSIDVVLPTWFHHDLRWLAENHALAPSVIMGALSDAQLMRRYQSGDEEAFGSLYLRYGDRLHRFILRMAASSSEAEEIFQDVWLAVIRDKARYRPTAKFVTFLFAIAHQRTIDRWRFHGRVVEEPLPPTETDIPALVDAREREPDHIVQSAERAQILVTAIVELPALQRAAFLMHADGSMTIEEIAQATGTNRETAKSRLRYANQRLRRALENRR